MRTARTRLNRGVFAVVVTGTAAVALLACFEDFTVRPPETDGGAQVDSATPPSDGATPPVDGGVDARDDGDAGPRITHCDSVVPPVGVNPGDFLCADFDSPLLSKGWDSITRTDGGVIEKTSDVAVSPPNAMSTTASGSFGQGTLFWRKGAAQRFTEATAVFQINPTVLGGVVPAATGTLELMHMTTSNASVTFGYSRGSNDFGGPPGYDGYFVNVAAFGGAAAIQRFKITGAPLEPNVWTEVKVIWEATGSVIVLYNNTKIFSETGFSSLDTSVSFRLGAYAAGNVGVMPFHRFDDVALSIRR